MKKIAIYLPVVAEYSRRLADGVRRYCRERDGLEWRDFWYSAESGYIDATRGPLPWAHWKPDGLLAHACPAEVDMAWLKASVPCAVVTSSDCVPDLMPSVFIDRKSVARLALHHFIELGLEQFAFVGSRGYHGSKLTEEALAAELARQKLPLHRYELPVTPFEGIAHLEDQAARDLGLLEFLQSVPRPIALMANIDGIGRVVCDACLAAGLNVPGDVAVLSVDNTILAESSTFSLSSIHTPGEEVGYRAMELLERLLAGDPPPRKPVLVPATQLVVRQSTAGDRHMNPEMLRAMRLVRQRACQGLRVADLAAMLSVSRSHLEHEFVRLLGYPPGEEIRRVRLATAEELLGTTDLPITQIAGQVGFERTANFSEFFRKQSGMSPRAYRQAKRKEQ